MNKRVLLGALVLSLAAGLVNNLLSSDPVDWMGSPEVLEKPEDY